MEGSAEAATAVVELGSSPSSPEAKRRRRCVQSKLSWGARGAEGGYGLGAVAKVEEEREEAEESEEEGRRKPRRKRKTQPRRQKKSPVASKEAQGLISRDKSSFPSDKKSLEQKPEKEQLDAVALKTGRSKRCKALESKVGSKNCQQLNKLSGEDTPRKASIPGDSDLKESYCKRKLINGKSDDTVDLDGESPHLQQQACDLWLEAKMAAEENMRLSAGKQMHPFFTCRKAAKKVLEAQDLTKVESGCWSTLGGVDLISCRPVHVFDTLGDDLISLDWRSWVFTEKSLLDLNGCCDLENASSVFGSSVKPLKLDSICQMEMHHQVSDTAIARSSTASATASPIPCVGHDQIMQQLSDVAWVRMGSNFSLSSNCHRYVSSLENEHWDILHKERLSSYYRRHSYWPECSLWTDKYRPEHASEVCGNSKSVRSLGEWLKSWHEKGQQSSQNCKTGEYCSIEDGEDSSYANESDVDDVDDMATLKNVLLITGPVGSGKTAAIYACAKEQGFEVIEVNASDLRNGACVKQKFGEAMESHGFNRWSVEEVICSKRKHKHELLPSTPDIKEAEDEDTHIIETVSEKCTLDLNSSQYRWTIKENNTAPAQVANKTLILFEDVDTVFDEDRGFISTILHLAETTKRPIILTSNSKNPILPQLLDRLILDFKRPSPEELLSHLLMICAFERAQISSHLLDHLVRSCLGDIRKTLMLLQYWCEGKKSHVDMKMQCTYSPLPFDMDAAHLVMPRVIPWELRCELSEKVAEVINKTISVALEAVEQQELNLTELMDSSKIEEKVANTNKTKKRRKLKKNHSVFDCTEFPAHANDLNDFSDASDSPAKNTRQTVKHRPFVLQSPQSDDALCADDLPPADITSKDQNNRLLSDNATVPELQKQESLSILELPTHSTYQSRREANQSPFGIWETVSVSHICDTFKLQDVSFVPESSFMPGTEVNRRDAFARIAASSNSVSVSFPDIIQSISVMPDDETNNQGAKTGSNKCLEFSVGDAHELDVESVHGNEDLGNSLDEDRPPVCGYQLMDECSQADFSMQLVAMKRGKGSAEAGSVQETWTKLRSQCADLRSYLTSNQKEKEASLIVKLTSALADLVCETELMFSRCKPLISDILEPSLTPIVEPDASSWYDEQFEMGSTYAQHGLCFYTSKCAAIGSVLGLENKVDLAQEMLASSTNSMALGKLLIQGNSAIHKLYNGGLDTEAPRCSPYIHSIGRELEPGLYNAILPIIPARSCMTLRGLAFHEYLSYISQISKLESSRLTENINRNTQRRSRASWHYLSSGPLSLSPESIELLAQSNCFKEEVP